MTIPLALEPTITTLYEQMLHIFFNQALGRTDFRCVCVCVCKCSKKKKNK